jgi:predicted CXXCH cytochrome family protein
VKRRVAALAVVLTALAALGLAARPLIAAPPGDSRAMIAQAAKPTTPPSPAPAPAAAGAPAAAPPRESCVTCHLESGDERLVKIVTSYDGDIHRAKGFGCTACHGGDPRQAGMEAMDPGRGFVGKPARQQIVQLCGRCHADGRFMKQYNPQLRIDQVAEYATSVHGRRLKEQNDPKVATCVNCHPAHAIKPPTDPASSVHPLHVAQTCGACHGDAKYMAEYKIPTDQPTKYAQSVHANAMVKKGDLSAPTCNDCHGNHGAAPPGVSWVGNVCGQCHTVMADLFGKSVHARAFREMGSPGCATCHDNHAIKPASDEMLGMSGAAVCAGCHAVGDAGGRSATDMRALIDRLRTDTDRARGTLRQAEHAGMEVSQAQFDLNGAKDALVKARASVHAFTVDAVKKDVEPGLAVSEKAQARGVRALKELGFRRAGLTISMAIIVALIAGLVLKIREVDRRGGRSTRSEGETRR